MFNPKNNNIIEDVISLENQPDCEIISDTMQPPVSNFLSDIVRDTIMGGDEEDVQDVQGESNTPN